MALHGPAMRFGNDHVFFVWFWFVSDHNNTGSLLGLGNLLMSAGIYLVLYYLAGKALKAFRIGVDRKANLLASQTLTVFTVDFIELFVSCAVTGQFRYFPQFLWSYVLLAFVQTAVLCILTLPLVDLYRKLFKPQQLLEVYGADTHENLKFMEYRLDKYHVAKAMCISEGLDKVLAEIDNYEAVLINNLPAETKNHSAGH